MIDSRSQYRARLREQMVTLRAARTRLQLSQADFARIAGVSAVTVRFWEAGRRKNRLAARLATILVTVAKHEPRIWDRLTANLPQGTKRYLGKRIGWIKPKPRT